MIFFILAAALVVSTLLLMPRITDFWLWLAYHRHERWRILHPRPMDGVIYFVGGWFSIMTPLFFIPSYLIYLGVN